jgi:2'-hydroxyisoflavone reductase
MPTTRRQFLNSTAAVMGALGLTGTRTLTATTGGSSKKLLILGGSGFIGPHMVQTALDRGHEVTIFNRGKTNTDLFPDIEKLKGDRDGDLESLKGRDWDAVIDNTGYVPRHVRDSADLLKGHVGRYLFTSTGSVYGFTQSPIDEDSPKQEITHPDSEDVNQHYGQLKVLCEQAVGERYGDAATIVRPHIVAGPGDTTDRYTYWPARIDQGGEVIVPGSPADPVQYIDVRDLSEFCLHLVETDTPGTFNGAGPAYSQLSMQELIFAIRGVTATDVRFTWIDGGFLAGLEGDPVRFPLYIPPDSPMGGWAMISIARSVASGLTLRPLAVTAHDTLEWFREQSQERRDRIQFNLERNAGILKAWHERA